MKRYLLDTNVVSELRKNRPHGGVVAWLGEQSNEQLFISALTAGEVQAGIERTRRSDRHKAEAIEAWLEQLIATAQVLPMDAACFREWARLMSTRSDELIEDAMIAATARVNGLVVATRNVKDFASLDVQVVNPFSHR